MIGGNNRERKRERVALSCQLLNAFERKRGCIWHVTCAGSHVTSVTVVILGGHRKQNTRKLQCIYSKEHGLNNCLKKKCTEKYLTARTCNDINVEKGKVPKDKWIFK